MQSKFAGVFFGGFEYSVETQSLEQILASSHPELHDFGHVSYSLSHSFLNYKIKI